jgi:uncharacterized protein
MGIAFRIPIIWARLAGGKPAAEVNFAGDTGGNMVSQELLEILRCPNCVREKEGLLEYFKEYWLICQDCGRKYPIRDDIPVMLIDEGDKWVNTVKDDLPIPPPT